MALSPQEDDADDGHASTPSAWDRTLTALLIAVLLAVLVGLFVLIFRVLTTDTDLGLVTTDPESVESAALIRANERIVQLVQWTLSTILVVAGGLLGLNWYQNQKRYEQDKADLTRFRRRMEERVRKAEQSQEQLAEHHRSHLLVQAVDEVTRTDNVRDAFSTIMSWYGQIREVDNARQERALSLIWQGFEFIEELIIEKGAAPVFFSQEPEEEERFLQFLDDVESTYPEVGEFTTVFRSLVSETP